MSATAPLAATSIAPRFVKVSDSGLLLPRTAAEWSGVYIPAAELTVARRIMPMRAEFKRINELCGEADLCGAKAARSISLKEFINLLLEYDRTGPALNTDFFTVDDPWQWIWTCDECAPRGCAFYVYLGYGCVGRALQGFHGSALACRPGQLPWPSEEVAATYTQAAA